MRFERAGERDLPGRAPRHDDSPPPPSAPTSAFPCRRPVPSRRVSPRSGRRARLSGRPRGPLRAVGGLPVPSVAGSRPRRGIGGTGPSAARAASGPTGHGAPLGPLDRGRRAVGNSLSSPSLPCPGNSLLGRGCGGRETPQQTRPGPPPPAFSPVATFSGGFLAAVQKDLVGDSERENGTGRAHALRRNVARCERHVVCAGLVGRRREIAACQPRADQGGSPSSERGTSACSTG